MLSHPTAVITIADGEITVDAERLAPKLGLSAAALKTEMRKGNVSSGAETGIDEDAGRTRVSFRYRTRAWTVVVEPDGTLVESGTPAAATSAPEIGPFRRGTGGQLKLSDLVRRTAS